MSWNPRGRSRHGRRATWRKLVVLGRAPANVVPRRFGPDEEVRFDPNPWIAIHASERDPVDVSR
jgi:hypothetical protein